MVRELGEKHILELPLNNNIETSDCLAYDNSASGNTFRLQFGGLVDALALYFPEKDFSNMSDEEILALVNKLGVPKSPDNGTGLVLRSHGNETETGLSNLSTLLINAAAHILTDKYAGTLTKVEFENLCKYLSGETVRDLTGTADGLLANRDLTNLTPTGILNATRVPYYNLVQTTDAIEIPLAALGKCVQISLTEDVSTITLPTSGLDATSLQQVIIIIKRNGFNIASNAFTGNGYTLRGTGASMPNFSASFTKDKAIEFFCEYDSFTEPSTPTWNYGYSKIGH